MPSLQRTWPIAGKLIAGVVVLCLSVDASASGFPPFVRDDSVTVRRGGTVSQLDSNQASVLDNDVDLEGDKLTAVLDRDVEHGSLELREDGTFIYTHDGSSPNSDSFRYRAFDGTRYSSRATVSITIEDEPNSPPLVISGVPDQIAVEGVAFTLELASNFSDPDPDDVLTFSARGLPNSRSLAIDAVTGVLSGTPASGDARDKPYSVEITASDLAGANATLAFPLSIRRDDRADVALELRVVTNPIGVGETSRWEIEITNNGPSGFEGGELVADWATAGPVLSLTAPSDCSLSGNNTKSPSLSCNVSALEVDSTLTLAVEAVQDGDGDSSVIGKLIADDPLPENNTDLASAQVVARFSEGPTQTIRFSGTDIDYGDLNGDARIDIVATGPETVIFLNDGARALTTPGMSLGSATGASVVTLLDWNGDGLPDVAVGGLASATAEIFVNNGSGSFESSELLQRDVGIVNEIVGADFDLDGQSELVIAGSAGIEIAQGNGDFMSLSSNGGIALMAADIELDGDQDIVAVNANDRAVELYYNDGSGAAFSREVLRQGSVATTTVADINGDDLPDLLLGLDGSDLSAPRNYVLYQQSGGSFSASQSFGASPLIGLLAGDIDGDGWTDVAAINQAGVHQVYLGLSGGNLSLAPEQVVSDGIQRGILVDFNGDESLDLILVGRATDILEVHANNGNGSLGLGDRISPDLQLLGEATMSIPAGTIYTEPGATAIDDIDGDITEQIEISGTVDTSTVGTQTLIYTVADRAGNSSSTVRTITVGVNSGTGGGGGGTTSPTLLLLLVLLTVFRCDKRSWRRESISHSESE